MVGLTVVAFGTSAPELAVTLRSAGAGPGGVPGGVPVAPAALAFDLLITLAVMCGCLPVFFNGWRIARCEGLLFLGTYAAYTAYLVLSAGSRG